MRSRRFVSMIAIALLIVPALQPGLRAAAPQSAPPAQSPVPAGTTVSGNALQTDLRAFPGATVRLRRFDSAEVAGSSTTGRFGEFGFAGVQPGNYFLELVNAEGRLVGTGRPFSVVGTAPVSVSIVAAGVGVTSAADGGGFSLFGLGPAATIGVLGAAAATAVTAATAMRSEASPSR
jgi:hypothetical protein